MCVMSMVFDHYDQLIPKPSKTVPDDWLKPIPVPTAPNSSIVFTQQFDQKQIDELKQLIKDFREALTAAKVVDNLTKQPDCEDPEKAKLLERVALLEKKIAGLEKPKKKSKK